MNDKDKNVLERRKKAEAQRYKKSALAELNIDTIQCELEEMSEYCDNIRYFIDDGDETLLNALDGDEEEAWEFKMLFSDLSAECENLYDLMSGEYITEHFDDFFVGIAGRGGLFKVIGYDAFEEDYYNLSLYDANAASTESGKRIKRLTKDEIIAVCGQCFGLAMSYFDIKYKYDYLKAEFDFVNDKNMSYLKAIKDIEAAYNEADAEDWYEYSDSYKRFDKLISALPDRAWIE